MATLPPLVLKFGGSNFDPAALDPFAQAVAKRLATGGRILAIVHGGGKDLSALLAQLGQEPRFVDGLRVTDSATLDAAELVLSGRVNKRIARALQRAGVAAVGIAGTDGALLEAEPRMPVRTGTEGRSKTVDLGRVGLVRRVDPKILHVLSASGFVPVVSPLALGPDGEALNVNADEAAAAIAGALAGELRLVTNVPGILNGPDADPLSWASPELVRELKANGVIRDGMVPKVDSCLQAMDLGAPVALIQSLAAFLAGGDAGTRIGPK